jgi:hypothetical protein
MVFARTFGEPNTKGDEKLPRPLSERGRPKPLQLTQDFLGKNDHK